MFIPRRQPHYMSPLSQRIFLV